MMGLLRKHLTALMGLKCVCYLSICSLLLSILLLSFIHLIISYFSVG